eukprot:scaffold3526_cov153-Amphora_coffeaeformis.AAC.8
MAVEQRQGVGMGMGCWIHNKADNKTIERRCVIAITILTEKRKREPLVTLFTPSPHSPDNSPPPGRNCQKKSRNNSNFRISDLLQCNVTRATSKR